MNTYNYIEERFENDSTFSHPVEVLEKLRKRIERDFRIKRNVFVSYLIDII